MEIFNYAGDIDGSEYTCGAIAGIDRYIVKGVILSVKGLGKVIVCLGVSYLFYTDIEAIDEDGEAVAVESSWDEETKTLLVSYQSVSKEVCVTGKWA